MLQFAIGVFIGVIIGFFIASMMIVSRCADCRSEKAKKEDVKDAEETI